MKIVLLFIVLILMWMLAGLLADVVIPKTFSFIRRLINRQKEDSGNV